ncbi:immunoglobulin domain-containing protein [Burkholderia sp. Ac-20353]|uniref:immunoglobulin domain-containing protein n=1 Tax=Burkholderia sp. Ac-20353 TaxID=2703894 RepID=UPI00197B7A8A|nr:immunoglobulin domain-containing protein [Burkholderia sp. Ac-20353]MBN3785390.1 immunoglobulin domain-containing protein [Burkholderia sp. Ac-20353]
MGDPEGLFASVLAALSALLGACGGDNDSGSATQARFPSTAVSVGDGSQGGASGNPVSEPGKAISAPVISISVQPQSITVTSGQTATFSVTASGNGPLMYQWLIDDVKIAGAMSSKYTTGALSIGDTNSVFSVVVSDVTGKVTSAGAKLSVRPPETGVTAPSITSQPRRQSVLAGQTATFFVAVESSQTPTYQWRRNGVAIPAAIGASYTTPPVASTDNGARYSVEVHCGAGSTTSADAMLNVTSAVAASR